jgi:hypothetical protein
MFNQIKTFREYAKQTGKEAGWWAYAAWTLPFVALAAIVFEHFIGHDDWIATTLVVVSTTFFAVSVYWWWWALTKIAGLVEGMTKINKNVDDVITELKHVRREIKPRKRY